MQVFFGKMEKKLTKAAEAMKMTADDLKQLNVIEKIFKEPVDYNVTTLEFVTDRLKTEIDQFLIANLIYQRKKLLMKDIIDLGECNEY